MTNEELNKKIEKLANSIRDYCEETGRNINDVVEQIATDFHPEFTEPVGELVYELLGWDCYTEYNDAIYTPKFNEIMHRIGMELELEA